MEPGELVTINATFIEERQGRALVRLPNGSKTSVAFGALSALGVQAHVSDDGTGTATKAFCSQCDYSVPPDGWNRTIEAITEHWQSEHQH